MDVARPLGGLLKQQGEQKRGRLASAAQRPSAPAPSSMAQGVAGAGVVVGLDQVVDVSTVRRLHGEAVPAGMVCIARTVGVERGQLAPRIDQRHGRRGEHGTYRHRSVWWAAGLDSRAARARPWPGPRYVAADQGQRSQPQEGGDSVQSAHRETSPAASSGCSSCALPAVPDPATVMKSTKSTSTTAANIAPAEITRRPGRDGPLGPRAPRHLVMDVVLGSIWVLSLYFCQKIPGTPPAVSRSTSNSVGGPLRSAHAAGTDDVPNAPPPGTGAAGRRATADHGDDPEEALRRRLWPPTWRGWPEASWSPSTGRRCPFRGP
jgi:hypothetical protein